MSKYEYYLKKPKNEITKDILAILAVSGAVAFAATSPYFGANLARRFFSTKEVQVKKGVRHILQASERRLYRDSKGESPDVY